jgi:hypothetical protein
MGRTIVYIGETKTVYVNSIQNSEGTILTENLDINTKMILTAKLPLVLN